MLLELARWLQQLESLFGLFNYLTFRGILAALTALFLSLWMGPAVIRKLAQFKGGQPIRQDGPQTHFSKAGTPTMGGSLILLTVTLSVLLWGDLRNRYVWLVLAVMVCFGAIGWYDDWIKIVRRDPNGLKSRWKYLLQSIFGLAAGLFLYYTADVPAAITFYIPMFKSIALPLAGVSFVVIAYFWIVGFSNMEDCLLLGLRDEAVEHAVSELDRAAEARGAGNRWDLACDGGDRSRLGKQGRRLIRARPFAQGFAPRPR